MTNEILEKVVAELTRIESLPIDEQPAAYGVLHATLQSVLDGQSWSE